MTRLNLRWRWCALILLSIPAILHADNAALQYWRAFAVQPTLTEKQQKIAADWQTTAMNGEARALIAQSTNALIELHRGAAISSCDWGLHFEDGMNLLLPYLGKARDLARLACLRARKEFEEGDDLAAIQDLADTLCLARHCGQDNIAICVLVQDAIEQNAYDTLTPHLGLLNQESLKELKQRLESLPAGGSLKGSAAAEQRLGIDWLIDRVEHVRDDAAFQDLFKTLMVGSPAAKQIFPTPPTREELLAQLKELRPYYEKVTPLFDLPASQFHTQLAEFNKPYINIPAGKLLVTTYDRFYDRHMAAQTHFALLKGAVAILLSGPDQIKLTQDPATHAPFDYIPRNDGFQLRSSLNSNTGAPLSITVTTRK